MTLNEKLNSIGWTTKASLTPYCKLIYDAEGEFIGDCTALQCWNLIKETENEVMDAYEISGY